MDEIIAMLNDCEERESKMTEWEAGFVSDIQSKVESGYRLSEKQEEKLIVIWESVTKEG